MKYAMLGLMSGTSLDGVDLCRCNLANFGGHWSYEIVSAATVPYPNAWRARLDAAIDSPRTGLAEIDAEYAGYLAGLVLDFQRGEAAPVVLASHGHTVHHVPAEGYTRQIGSPQILADLTGYRVVGDFRSGDVALGGQGAPLVPIVDRMLFGDKAVCINLGGFANLSFEREGERVASDVTVCNLLLNRLAEQLQLRFDESGHLAATGRVDRALLTGLNGLPFFALSAPKSLGREWFEQYVWPLFWQKLTQSAATETSVRDLLATAVAHVVGQLTDALPAGVGGEVLVTGGGAFNAFLIDGFRQNLPNAYRLAVAPPELIEYKEALAFALLGALRLRGEINVLSSVTGARRDSSSGVVAEPSAVGAAV